jgi:hypothetical protein
MTNGPKVAGIYFPVARRELAEQATLCSVFGGRAEARQIHALGD